MRFGMDQVGGKRSGGGGDGGGDVFGNDNDTAGLWLVLEIMPSSACGCQLFGCERCRHCPVPC